MSGTWIIFEGPDGAGKTSLARRAVAIMTEKNPTVSQHLTNTSDFSEYYGPPRLWIGSGLNVVQDRCIISDLVYSPVLRGTPSKFGEKRVRRQLELVAQYAVIIHVTADEDTLCRRLRSRGDDLITEEMMDALLKNYWRQMGWWEEIGAQTLEFDTTDDAFPTDLYLELAIATGVVGLERAAEKR